MVLQSQLVRVKYYNTRIVAVSIWHARQVQKWGRCNGRYGGFQQFQNASSKLTNN